ncbi:MAG: hypothetical protein H6R10_722 [Rhodocyclaceae bacterium]|nr:hypothetical protein [Rhodocyclaceae bacterium]
MRSRYDYSLLRLIPDASRGEVVNIGLVVFGEAGVDVRITPNLAKARALSAWVNPEHLRTLPQAIPAALNKLNSQEMQLFALQGLFSPVTADGMDGSFFAGHPEEYEAQVEATLSAYVTPEPKTRRASRAGAGRLYFDLRTWFARNQLLGRNTEEIRQHKVVTHYPVNTSAGIYAEFALKNGVYRITETIDFRVKDVGAHKSNEAAAKAMTLIEARAALGSDTERYAIVAANDYSKVQAQINLLGRHANHVLMRDSAEDMAFYAQSIAKAAKIPQLDLTAFAE